MKQCMKRAIRVVLCHWLVIASLVLLGMLPSVLGLESKAIAVSSGSTIPLSGTWKGSLSSRLKDGYAEISWTIFQSGPNVSGRFVCTGGTLKCHTVDGAVAGTVIDTIFDARMLYTDGHLCGLTGTISGTTIQGEYSCDDKLGEDRGTWQMSWEKPGPPES
jgi:hypothetical protein